MLGITILLIMTLYITYAACIVTYEVIFMYGDKLGCGVFLVLAGYWWYALISGITVTIN
jgi:hypothetical protein